MSTPDQTRDRRVPLIVGVGVFIAGVLSPGASIGDSRMSAAASWQFLTHGNLFLGHNPTVAALSNKYDLVVRNGHVLPYFPWPTMLLAVPADIVVWVCGLNPATLSIVNSNRTFLVEIPTASAMVAIATVVLRQTMIRFGASRRTATVTGLLFAFTTSAWSVGSRALFQMTASLLFLSLLLYGVVVVSGPAARGTVGGSGPVPMGPGGRNPGVMIGLAGALAAICRPTNVVVVALTFGWVLLRSRPAALRMAASAAVVLAVFLAISRANYGEWLPPYYGFGRYGEHKAVPVLEGLAYNLVSPSRGMLLYDPIIVLSAIGFLVLMRNRQLSAPAVISAISLPVQLLLIASYGSDGGTVYGPRLMTDILPFMAVLAAPAVSVLVDRGGASELKRASRAAVAITVVITSSFGLFVNATGALLRSSRCWSITPVSIDAEPSRAWDWSDPQFLWPYQQLLEGGSVHDVMSPNCAVGPT